MKDASTAYPNVATPPCGTFGKIHPRNKTEVGRRLALKFAQLEGILPAGVVPEGPIATGIVPTSTGVEIHYDNVQGALALLPTADCKLAAGIPVSSTLT